MTEADFDLRRLASEAAEALNAGDVDAFVALVHPEVEFKSMVAEMEDETFRGHDGVRRWWASVHDAFDSPTWVYEDLVPDVDRGVAKLRIEGTLGGVELSQTMWQAIVTRDGLAVWWRFFRSEREALEAVGLDP